MHGPGWYIMALSLSTFPNCYILKYPGIEKLIEGREGPGAGANGTGYHNM